MFGRVEQASSVALAAGPLTFVTGVVPGVRLRAWVEETEMFLDLVAKVTLAGGAVAAERVDFTILVDGADVMTTLAYGGSAGYVNGVASATVPAGTASGPNTITSVGGGAATVDLATWPIAIDLPIFPGSLSIAVDVNGIGAKTIVDNGAGLLLPEPDALPLGGTINYDTGAMTGITGILTALSNLDESHTKSSAVTTALVRRTVRIPRGEHIVQLAAKYTTGPIGIFGAVIPCELSVMRNSHMATLGHGVDSKVQLIQ